MENVGRAVQIGQLGQIGTWGSIFNLRYEESEKLPPTYAALFKVIHKHQFFKVHDHHVYLDTDNVEQADKEKQRAWWSRSLPRMIWKPLLLYVAVYYVIFVVIESGHLLCICGFVLVHSYLCFGKALLVYVAPSLPS